MKYSDISKPQFWSSSTETGKIYRIKDLDYLRVGSMNEYTDRYTFLQLNGSNVGELIVLESNIAMMLVGEADIRVI